jgi:hypothetical protein
MQTPVMIRVVKQSLPIYAGFGDNKCRFVLKIPKILKNMQSVIIFVSIRC